MPFRAYGIVGSEWIDEMMTANRVHHHHDDRLFDSYRHFVFTFHDSVLEFVSGDQPRFKETTGDLRDLLYAEACRCTGEEQARAAEIIAELAARRH